MQRKDKAPSSNAQDRLQRLSALRKLANNADQTTTTPDQAVIDQSSLATDNTVEVTPIPHSSPRQNRRWWWGLLAVVLCVAIVGSVIIPKLLTQGKSSAPSPIHITPAADDLACLVDVSWSPNGRLIAVLGYHLGCPNLSPIASTASGQVDIYDTTTGKLVQQFQPDTLILQGHGVTLGPVIQQTATSNTFAPFIGYTTIIWSPNGQQLALPFIALQAPYTFPTPITSTQSDTSVQSTVVGVLLTNVSGKQARVLTAPYHLPAIPTGSYGKYGSSLEWNLASGRLATDNLPLPPALGYQWATQGALSPITPLTNTTAPAASPVAPIGDPVGGKTFTIWQPGIASQGLLPVVSTGSQPVVPQPAPGLYLWSTNFPIWSPDGQYLITPAYYGGRVTLTGQAPPSAATLQAAERAQTPALPARDSALQHLIQPNIFTPVAWSPDGKVMASVAYIHSAGSASGEIVTLANCQTGQPLTTLTVQSKARYAPARGVAGLGPTSDDGVFLRWSPNGSRLALLDANMDGVITIWGADSLPQV